MAAMDMTLRGLKDRARELGVAEDSIQGLDDTNDAKAAAVDLVLQATKDADAVGELARRHLNQASNIRRWAVTLSPFIRLRSTQGSMTPCDLIFEHTAFCRRPNMQGG